MDVFISGNRVFVDENKIISSGYTRTGNVYLLNDDYVLKLYRNINPQYHDYYKNKLDTLHKLKTIKFIMPLEITYDENGNVIGYIMKYIKGENGDAIVRLSSKFLIEELEKVHNEVEILSQNNVVIDDLIADNIIVNENGLHFIDVDDYITRVRLDYDRNMTDSNFCINSFLKEIFARMYYYKKNECIYEMFDDYCIFYKEAMNYYRPNQTVESLVRLMVGSGMGSELSNKSKCKIK